MKEPNGISQAIFAGAPKGIIFQTEPNGELNVIVGAAQ